MIKKFSVCILLFSFIACATTIGNKTDLKEVKFVIGQTKKQDVAETLGLPAGIIKKKEEGKEYWYYNKGPVLSGLDLPVVVAGSMTVAPFPVITNPELKDAAAIYVFDRSDVLINAMNKEK